MQDTYYYPDPGEEIAQKLYDSLFDLYASSQRMEGVSGVHYRKVIRTAKEVLQEAEKMDFITAPGDDYQGVNE